MAKTLVDSVKLEETVDELSLSADGRKIIRGKERLEVRNCMSAHHTRAPTLQRVGGLSGRREAGRPRQLGGGRLERRVAVLGRLERDCGEGGVGGDAPVQQTRTGDGIARVNIAYLKARRA
jgi:hypothetical protein